MFGIPPFGGVRFLMHSLHFFTKTSETKKGGRVQSSAPPNEHKITVMGRKQKIRDAKKESGDLKVDKTSKQGYDRQNVAEVIKRMKAMAKDDENRFQKMGMEARGEEGKKLFLLICAVVVGGHVWFYFFLFHLFVLF